MEEKEYSNIFAIPANYTDSGKLLGGMLDPRCAVEACVLLILIGYPELMWMPLPPIIKLVVMTVTLLPTGILAIMGIGGDSLFQYVSHMFMFWARRRTLHLRRIGYQYDKNKIKKTTFHPKRKRRPS